MNVIAANGVISNEARWLMAGAVALKLTVIGLLEYTLCRDPYEPTHEHGSSLLKFAGAGLALLIGVVGADVNAVTLMLLLLVPMLLQIFYGVWVWFNRYPNAPLPPTLEIETPQV